MGGAAFVIVAASVAVLTVVSLAADRRLRGQARLPMQWALDGSVNWSAPRRLALGFTPVLAAAILLLAATMLGGETGRGVGTVALIGVAFVAAHLLHVGLWMRRKAA